jgi:hypothetical protein
MTDKSLVKNAADEKQVKKAKQKEKSKRDFEIEDMKAVLRTAEGRRFIWRILEQCNVFGSIWHPSAAIHHNAGKQDLGHFLMGEVSEAGDDFLFIMMKENYNKGELNV